MGDRLRRARRGRPALEAMEGRALLSGLGVLLAGANGPAVSASVALAQRISASGSVTALAAVDAGAGAISQPQGNSFTDNTSSPLLGSGTPTPHEALREAFKAGFDGRYYKSPGRFSDQGTTYFFRGVGGSSFFLHGDFNMAVITPLDPTSPFVGEAVLNDKSTATSGILGLVLTGDRSSVDAHGRPTHLTLTADPNIYSGAFSVAAAEGTVDIKYGANNQARVTFNARVYTSGLTSPLVNTDLYARHGRPLVYRGHSAAKRT